MKRNRQKFCRFFFYLFIPLSLISLRSKAQINLVTNGDFETYDTCPSTLGQIYRAVPWFQPNTGSFSSTDYYNSCASGNSSVPLNYAGYQTTHSGNGYGGEGVIESAQDSAFSVIGREYMEGILSQPLTSNHKYCVSMYTALGNSSEMSSEIGIFFTPDSLLYSSSNYHVINATPQLVESDVIKLEDTLNWVQLKWQYVAGGGERFLTIGGYWAYPIVVYDCLTANCLLAYYYIDDVSIVELPDLNAGLDVDIVSGDTTLLTGNISQQWAGMQFEWLPHNGLSNPFSLNTLANPTITTTYTLTVSCSTCNVPCLSDIMDSITVFVEPISPPQTFSFHVPTLLYSDQFFQIDSLVPGTKVKLFDMRGRKIFESDNYANDFSVEKLSGANYIYEVILPSEKVYNGKFYVVKR